MEHSGDIGPARTKVRAGQGIQVLPFGGVATVRDQVNFQKARVVLRPIR